MLLPPLTVCWVSSCSFAELLDLRDGVECDGLPVCGSALAMIVSVSRAATMRKVNEQDLVWFHLPQDGEQMKAAGLPQLTAVTV
jgi:hypothetical protein